MTFLRRSRFFIAVNSFRSRNNSVKGVAAGVRRRFWGVRVCGTCSIGDFRSPRMGLGLGPVGDAVWGSPAGASSRAPRRAGCRLVAGRVGSDPGPVGGYRGSRGGRGGYSSTFPGAVFKARGPESGPFSISPRRRGLSAPPRAAGRGAASRRCAGCRRGAALGLGAGRPAIR